MNLLASLRTLALAGSTAVVGALLISSCLTPDFQFGEGPPVGGGGGIGAGGAGPRPETCFNGIRDGGESDVDCGGPCAPCGTGRICNDTADCSSQVCSEGTCAAPTCDDNIKNGNETDIDCGGSCEPCGIGEGCATARDCVQPLSDDAAITQCESSTCTLLCPMGRADCNRNAADGCEANIQTSLTHCGECRTPCSPENATGQCQAGNCRIQSCEAGFADLNDDPSDGCEIDTNTDPKHCGPSRVECSSNNGTPSCVDGECTISCNDGYADCNENLSDGCEVNLNSNVNHCSECGNACDEGTAMETPYCSAGVCGLTECPSGLGDCNGNGECTDDLTTVDNCGGCGTDCQAPQGTPACTSGECSVASCDSGYRDCSSDPGCETNINTDPFHCGGCNMVCSNTNVQTLGCTAGACTPSCQSDWCAATDPRANGCNRQIGTPQACRNCNEQCSGSTPFCTPNGCRSYQPVEVVNQGTTATGTSRDLVFSHNLQTSHSQNPYRAVVLLLGNKTNDSSPPTVLYGTQEMTLAVARYSGNQAWSGIYYQLSSALPTPGARTIQVTGGDNQQLWTARVVELINVRQIVPQTAQQGAPGSACNNPSLTVTSTTTAWIGSVLTEWRDGTGENAGALGNNLNPYTFLGTSDSVMSHGRMTATSGSSTTLGWTGCSSSQWAHVVAAFYPRTI